MKNRPIIIIDDDPDDLQLLKEAFAELHIPNEIVAFTDGNKFIDYMHTTEKRVFFILCDINMGNTNGLILKEQIHSDERLRLKCIPFIFLTTSRASSEIMKAYSFGVQGFFVKPQTFSLLVDLMEFIVKYWRHSMHPNSDEHTGLRIAT